MVNKTTKKSGISVGELGLHNSKTPIAPVVVKAPVAKASAIVQAVVASIAKAPVEKASAVVQAVEKAPVVAHVAKASVAKETIAKEPVAKASAVVQAVEKAPVVAPVAKASAVVPVVAKAPVVVAKESIAKTPAIVQAVVAKESVAKESVAKAPVVVAKESVAKAPVVVPVVAKAPVVVAKTPAIVQAVVAKESVAKESVAKAPVVAKAPAVIPVVGKAPVVAKESLAKASVVVGGTGHVVGPVVGPVVGKTLTGPPIVADGAPDTDEAIKDGLSVGITSGSTKPPRRLPEISFPPSTTSLSPAPAIPGPPAATATVEIKAPAPAETAEEKAAATPPAEKQAASTTETPTEPGQPKAEPAPPSAAVPTTTEKPTEPAPAAVPTTEKPTEPAPAAVPTTEKPTEPAPAAVPTTEKPTEPAPAPAPAETEKAAPAEEKAPAAPGQPSTATTPPAATATESTAAPSTTAAPGQPSTESGPPLTAPSTTAAPGQPSTESGPPLTPPAPGQPSTESGPPLTVPAPAEITATTASGKLQPEVVVITNIDIKKDVQKGGSPMDNNLYKLFTSILLLTSCLLFCIATVLFINACINFHKAKNEFMKDENKELIIEQPIFEYLKPNNFLYIDKFLLDMKESQSPVVITFGIIIAISFTCLGGLIAYWSQTEKFTFDNWLNSLNKSSFLKYLPILYIIIIGIVFNNSIITANKNTLKTFEDEFDNTIINFNFEGVDINTRKLFLEELKKILIREIYNNYKNDSFEYNEETITDELVTKPGLTGLTTTNIQKIFGTSSNTKYTIPQVIFYIYKLSYYFKKPEKTTIEYDKLIKDNIQEYINRIDRYFNLLINDINNNGTNYYTKFYLISLIKKDSNDYGKDINALKTLNEKFNEKIESIKNRIQSYYIVIIVFYLLLLIGLLIYYFENLHNLLIFLYKLLFIYNIDILRAFISIIIIIIVLTVLFTLRNYKI
jgi:hypothetical protein